MFDIYSVAALYLAFLLVILCAETATIIHEAGHAIACKILGVHIFEIYIGALEIFSVNLFGTKVVFGLLPITGGNEVNLNDRWERLIPVLLAGPFFNLLVALVLMSFLPGGILLAWHYVSMFFTVGANPVAIEIVTFIASFNFLLAVVNLIPIGRIDGGMIVAEVKRWRRES